MDTGANRRYDGGLHWQLPAKPCPAALPATIPAMPPTLLPKLLLLTVLFLFAPLVWAQDDDDWDDEEEFVQLPLGIPAVYQSLDGTTLLERIEPVPRLFGGQGDGGQGDSIHWKVPGDGFRVTWKGRLLVPYDGDYTFRLNRSTLRDVSFTLYGKPVRPGEPVELLFGNVPLELSGVQRGGRPELELAWEHETFVRETVRPRFFGHLPAAAESPEVVRQAMVDSGAALAESFGCFRCHEGPRAWVESLAAGVEPEVLLPGPVLSGTGRRLHRAWLRDYLTDPAAHRPGTRMPAQLADRPADRAALETIVAYLGSGQTAELAGELPDGSQHDGLKLYESHGCAACHEPPEGSVVAVGTSLRIPSPDRLAEKWTAGGLVSFLRSPLIDRPHGRMPDFALSGDDARHLVAYAKHSCAAL